MTIQKFLDATISVAQFGPFRQQRARPMLVCNDGLELSVQASAGHYCTPKQDGIQEYNSVEVYADAEAWNGLTENEQRMLSHGHRDDGGGICAGWTPVAVVEQIVENHGGINPLS